MANDWLDEIEAQADDTSPYYLPRLIAEIRRLRRENARREALIESLKTVVAELLEANQGIWAHSVQGRAYIRKCEQVLNYQHNGGCHE